MRRTHRLKPVVPVGGRWLVLWLFAALGAVGCASQSEWVTLRDAPQHRFSAHLASLSMKEGRPSERTVQLLRRYDLEGELRGDRAALLTRLDDLATPATLQEHRFAIAELAYLGAKHEGNSQRASELYSTALLHAHRFLFDGPADRASNPYDPQFRGACDLYNESLEGLLRIVMSDGPLRPGERRTLNTANHACAFDVVMHSRGWHGEDLDRFEFVSDYQVNGLRNHYHTYGLGVPLIAIRRRHEEEDAAEAYYPNQLAFPLTALLRVSPPPDPADEAVRQASYTAGAAPPPPPPAFRLELHDPLDRHAVTIDERTVPLESDLSTPLAYFLNQPALREDRISTLGLLRPDSVKRLQGLYMLEPFDPQKMPVLMVHGLWSSPATWMEMFNDLRSDPHIRDHYQFWFYLYPSGQPFWLSAAQLRADLAELRHRLDPQRRSYALDQMVLVGHSMGGLVSRMQSVDSDRLLWEANTERPFSELEADDDVRARLAATYFFRPNPSVRRVVTIGTPHRGSDFANDLTTWLGDKLIAAPMRVIRGRRELFARNPGYFRLYSPVNVRTSIESLDPDSRLLPSLLAAKPGPWVSYHNIVGRAPESTWHKYFGREGDGVVSIESARLDESPQVESQVIVGADHMTVHRHPQSILEVRRILMNHLAEHSGPSYGGGRVQFAEAPRKRMEAGNMFHAPPPPTPAR